jgi:hypothetical protein
MLQLCNIDQWLKTIVHNHQSALHLWWHFLLEFFTEISDCTQFTGGILVQLVENKLQNKTSCMNVKVYNNILMESTDIVVAIDRFHLTSRRPYWCTKTMKWRPYWCTVWELALSYSNISYCFTSPLGPPITWVKTIYRASIISVFEILVVEPYILLQLT